MPNEADIQKALDELDKSDAPNTKGYSRKALSCSINIKSAVSWKDYI
jgi:hypothetical protein